MYRLPPIRQSSIGLKHITEPIPELPDEVTDFQDIIDKALAKAPEDRFQTGQDFINALEDLEHDLASGGESTTIISAGAMKRHKGSRRSSSATRARTKTAGGRTRTGSRTGSRTRATASAAPTSNKTILAASIAGVVALAGIAGWWYVNSGEAVEENAPASTQAFSAKTGSLLAQAKLAVADGRLFEPPTNSAQYYYTTTLALAPRQSRRHHRY